jgi:hypothetical protein
MAKRCTSIINLTNNIGNNYDPNNDPSAVALAKDICENRLETAFGDTTPLTNYELVIGSIYKLGMAQCSLCRVGSPFPGAPAFPAIGNPNAFDEWAVNNDALAYKDANQEFPNGFMGVGALLEERVCFECKRKEIVTGDGKDVKLEDPFDVGSDDGSDLGLDPVIDPCKNIVFSLSVDGVVIDDNTGNSVPKECCTFELIGNKVIWDGEKCRLAEIIEDCPRGVELAVNDEGIIIGIKSEKCCTYDVTGMKDVYWDGRFCRINSDPCGGIKNVTIGPAPTYQVYGDGVPLKEKCCTRDIAGVDVVWQVGDTRATTICRAVIPPEPKIQIVLNEEPIETTECDDIITSMWLYFGSPNPICNSGVPELPADDPIFPDPIGGDTPIDTPIGGDATARFVIDGADCCYDRQNPILGMIKTDNPNVIVDNVAIFDSENDGFDTWAGLTVNLSNTVGNPFNLILEFTGGLTDCCDYDIHIDDIRIDCFKDEDRLIWKNNICPGFDIKHVVDNKKSWVYNPGLPSIGITEDDNIIRERGDFGLMEPHATINRTFAPSPDADLPWRYTDYLNRDGILEKHSKLVLNSKEVLLYFNMCANGGRCPKGYTYTSGGTCERIEVDCPDGYTLIDGFCSQPTTSTNCGVNYDFFSILMSEISDCYTGSTSGCSISSVWGVNAVLEDDIVYSNPNFFSSTGYTVPTQAQYVTELNNVANDLGLLFTSGSTSVTFTNNVNCEGTIFINKDFRIDLCLTVNLLCDGTVTLTKQFQDLENFQFQDGEDYDFN